ncbi:MAG: toll/interleukin-1 receptor domain-containing protein [Dehalococcoidia bacterium]|nr:toll/interleukin-1 receptor domain-containing protein [Dehalococcoidia bacterium]
MEKEILEVFQDIKESFVNPEFRGESARAHFKGKSSEAIFHKSLEKLEKLESKYPNSADLFFLSAIASRYTGDQMAFENKVKRCLQVAPDYPEAFIALREKGKYLDPFCYLSMEDLVKNPQCARSQSYSLNINSGQLDQVRDGLKIRPVLILKIERKKFRRFPLKGLDSALKIELCCASNYSSEDHSKPGFDPMIEAVTFMPLMILCTVIVDDKDDPFWKILFLNLFPIESIHGIELRPMEDYQPFLGRYQGLRLCQAPYELPVIIFDETETIIYFEFVKFHPSEIQNLKEYATILKALQNEAEDLLVWKLAPEIYQNHFYLEVKSVKGDVYSIPKWRNADARKDKIWELALKDGHVHLKDSEPQDRSEIVHDIFVSHSHEDQKIAYGLTEWMHNLWPDIDIYMSSRDQTDLARSFPTLYFWQIRRSKCVIFLLTPNAMRSPYVGMEMGSALSAQVKTIPILAQGLTKKDMLNSSVDINCEKAIELDNPNSEDELVRELCRILNQTAPKEDKIRTMKRILSQSRVIPEVTGQVNNSEVFSYDVFFDPKKQSKESALKWLDITEKLVQNKARIRGIKVEMLPAFKKIHSRITVVMTCSDENRFDELLKGFTPLIDDEFLQYLKSVQKTAFASNDEKMARTILKLLVASEKLFAAKNKLSRR